MSNTECCYKQYHNTLFFRQSEICNRKAIKYCPCLSCECKKKYEPDKCCCTDMVYDSKIYVSCKNATTQKLSKKIMMVFLAIKQIMAMIDSLSFFICYTIFYHFSSRLVYVIVLMKRLNSNNKSKIHLI